MSYERKMTKFWSYFTASLRGNASYLSKDAQKRVARVGCAEHREAHPTWTYDLWQAEQQPRQHVALLKAIA